MTNIIIISSVVINIIIVVVIIIIVVKLESSQLFACFRFLLIVLFLFLFSYFLRPCHARSAGCRAPTKVPVLTKLLTSSTFYLHTKNLQCILFIFNGSACCSYFACVVVVVVVVLVVAVVVVVERAPLYDSATLWSFNNDAAGEHVPAQGRARRAHGR